MPETPTSTPAILEAHDLVGAEETTLANNVPPIIGEHIRKAVESHPQFFGLDERDLFKKLRDSGYQPSAIDHRLRMNFWLEYDRAIAQGRKMQTTGIFHGVCSVQFLMERYIKVPGKIAWLLCPPATYAVKTAEALEFGIEQLRDILATPHINETGRHAGSFNSKVAEAKIKIVAMLDNRVKGAVVQRNLNVNLSHDAKSVETLAQENTMENLEAELKALEKRERLSKNLPMPKEDISVEHHTVKEFNGEGEADEASSS